MAWEANFNLMPATEGEGPDNNILMPSAILSTVRGFLRRKSAHPFCLLLLVRRFIVICHSVRDDPRLYISLAIWLPGMPRRSARRSRRFSAGVAALLGFFRRRAAFSPLLTP